MFTVADVGFNHLGTSVCLFNERNYKQKKNPYYSVSSSPISAETEIASTLLCSRTAFVGHDSGTGSASNSATERREMTGEQYWTEI